MRVLQRFLFVRRVRRWAKSAEPQVVKGAGGVYIAYVYEGPFRLEGPGFHAVIDKAIVRYARDPRRRLVREVVDRYDAFARGSE